ncbi:MAG: protein kinase domain-containing protein [Bacteroidales bacterium]
MSATRCPQCGALLPSDGALDGGCPACLLKLAMAPAASVDDARTDLVPGAPDGRALPERIGPYRIVRVLGEGGMGVVYLAEQEEPIERRVALKLVKPGCDSRDVLRRFDAERQALALMDHPGIARVLDAGIGPGGRPYFVMEYVAGIPITDYCDRNRLGTAERLELFLPVCAAIQHAHQKGMVHRDLKPSNILVTLQDGRPTPKVIDFGVAKATSHAVSEHLVSTEIGTLIGTPEYMSPEQADSTALDVDTTTDIYSLGVVLYELLTGSLPFEPATLRRAGYAEIRRIIREVEPPRPSARLTSGGMAGDIAHRRHTSLVALEREMRGDLDCITMKAIEKDRTRRYPSASEFASDIVRYLKGDVIGARPPSLRYRARKFVRRHRAGVAAAAIVVASLVVALSVSTIFYIRADQARKNAEEQAYSASISAAAALISADQPNEARSSLMQASHRGWEWWHLFLKTDTSIATLLARGDFTRFPARTTTFTFTLDGSRIFGNTDTTVQAWDAETFQTLALYRKLGRIVALGPQASTVLAQSDMGSKDYTLKVLETSSGRVLATLGGHTREVECAAFSRDGTRIVSGSEDGAIRVWDAGSGKPTALMQGPPGPECVVVFSPDGRWVASGAWGPGSNDVQVWDVESGRLAHLLSGHEGAVTALAFSRDGTRLASGAADRTIRIWAMPLARVTATLRGHEDRILSLAFSPDGQQLASGAYDSTVRVWDLASQHEIMRDAGFTLGVLSVGFSPDGSRLLAAGSQRNSDATIRVWDTRALGPWRTFAHESEVAKVAFSPDGATMAVGMEDGKVVLWDAISGDRLRVLSAHNSRVTALSFHPSQPLIASGSADMTVRVWDTRSGRLLRTFHDHQKRVTAIAFSPAGTELAAAGEDGLVQVCNPVSGASLAHWQGSAPVLALAFDRSAGHLLIGSGDRRRIPSPDARVRVWNWKTGKVLTAKELPNGAAVGSISVNGADGHIAAVGVGVIGGHTTVWDSTFTQSIGVLDSAEPVEKSVYSPDGSRILCLSTFGVVRVWDAATFKPLLGLNVPDATDLAFSPDGRRVAVASRKNVQLWNSVSAYHPDAEPLVTRLYGELGLADMVSADLRADLTLAPALREAALRLVQAWGDDEGLLNSRAWSVVSRPDAGAEAYRLALRRAERAVQLAPEDASYLNTLGVARYRAGAYRDAIATLNRAASARRAPAPEDLVFMAMANQRLGNATAARDAFDRFHVVMKDPENAAQEELRRFQREAEAIIQTAGGSPAKSRAAVDK